MYRPALSLCQPNESSRGNLNAVPSFRDGVEAASADRNWDPCPRAEKEPNNVAPRRAGRDTSSTKRGKGLMAERRNDATRLCVQGPNEVDDPLLGIWIFDLDEDGRRWECGEDFQKRGDPNAQSPEGELVATI